MGFKYLIPFLLDKVLFQENQQSLTIGLANHDLLENLIRQDDLSLGRGGAGVASVLWGAQSVLSS